MTPVLTLHQGKNRQECVEHPIEVARRALRAAAGVETGLLALSMLQAAESLPQRSPILAVTDPEAA
jgi:hypothetical protein